MFFSLLTFSPKRSPTLQKFERSWVRIPFKPGFFFQAFFSQLLKLHTNCEDLSSTLYFIRSSIYDVSYIHIHLFILRGYITNSQYEQLPVGLIAQLVDHCTGIAEVMGSNPAQA